MTNEERLELYPMDTAPVWDYYNGNVEGIDLFYRLDDHPEVVVSCMAYFNRDTLHWHVYYNNDMIHEELIGWLPRRRYVSPN
jgi:hypothetical protein